MSGRKGMLQYDIETKKEAVRLSLEEHYADSQIAEKLNIRIQKRIEAWVRMYRREGEKSFYKPIGRPTNEQSGPRELERLRMENALLKKIISNCGDCSLRSAISNDLPPQE